MRNLFVLLAVVTGFAAAQSLEIPRSNIDKLSAGSRSLVLSLPGGDLVEAIEVRRRTSHLDGTLLWHGILTGTQRGSLVLAVSADRISGGIAMDDGRYFRIASAAGAALALTEVKERRRGWVDDRVFPSGKHPERRAEPAPRTAAGDTLIDVLVVYTAAAKNAAGGTAAIQNKIQMAVAEANQGFLNSGVTIELRLVHTMETVLDDAAGVYSVLTAASSFTPDIQAARDQYGADLVSVWIHGSLAPAGAAYQMASVSQSFAPVAYSVIEEAGATGPTFAFAHEIGHNMGADHDRANAQGHEHAYSYSFGYQHTSALPYFRTIMAYACVSIACPVVNQWSNPDVAYQGAPTGVAANLSNSADNRLTLNNTKAVVAAFRGSTVCAYSFATATASHPAAGASGSVAVSTGGSCSWSASTSSPWITITAGSGTGNGTVSYNVAPNSGATARTGSITMGGQTFTVTQYGTEDVGSVTIQTTPPGLEISVDGQSATGGQTFQWPSGSVHTIQPVSPQGSGGTRYSFLNWSDSGAATRQLVVPLGPATYTANYTRQYLLAWQASPAQAGPVELSPASAGGYYNEGQMVQLLAVSSGGWQFTNWSGDLIGSTNPQALQMSAPRTVTANYTSLGNAVTVTTSPPSLKLTVDGNEYTAPQTFVWTAGSTHTIGARPLYESGSSRLAFNGWTDSGAIEHTVTTPAASATYIANYKTQYRLTASVSPLGSGTVSVSPAAADGFYDAGTNVQLTATASAAGFTFFRWGGDLGGSANPALLLMGGARDVQAAFAGASNCTYSLQSTEASASASGDLLQVSVSTGVGCAYGAASQASWIQVTSGASASNSGAVRLAVLANPGTTARTGTASIAGITYTVTQAGSGCTFTLSGPAEFLPVAGANSQVNVSTAAGCQWTVQKTAAWLSLTGTTSGTGSGVVAFQAAANTGAQPRTANLIIGGQWQHVIQRGTDSAPPYADVPPSELFFDYLALLKSKGIPDLCGANLVCPGVPILRSSMAVFLVRTLVGDSFPFSPTPYFTDVPASHPQFAYIQKLRDLGVTNGCAATTYCPDGVVNRAEMAAFVVRARLGIGAGQTFPFPGSTFFSDVPANHWAYTYIQKLREMGITLGCTATSYCPDNQNSRGQMGAFLVRGFF